MPDTPLLIEGGIPLEKLDPPADVTLEAARALVHGGLAVLQPLGPSCDEERWTQLVQEVADSTDGPADIALAALTVMANGLGLFNTAPEEEAA